MNTPALIYGLCLAASASCAALLGRAYLRSRMRLLLWTAVAFCFFALNNLALVVDMLLLPGVDLWVWRQAAAGAGLAVLIFGFVWEVR
ncbi:DUF5985 family protein [uncultured Phenylobacterium sp.]|uniref:DUF5985 family protein n=1 Tax=uncultured Phenylobacterium sp. TaxID=349273 RepID=UPI0025E2D77C|nr:DUF5985 family protein [uncultured Phenylobacterium sp.]